MPMLDGTLKKKKKTLAEFHNNQHYQYERDKGYKPYIISLLPNFLNNLSSRLLPLF